MIEGEPFGSPFCFSLLNDVLQARRDSYAFFFNVADGVLLAFHASAG